MGTNAYAPKPAAQPAQPAKKRRRWMAWGFLLLVVLPAAGFAGFVWLAMHFSYSDGERAGYVQKFSHKGWVCKSWEGELAMSTTPGTAPQIFAFSVRDQQVAKKVEAAAGQRVALSYEQHKFVPGGCLAETEYWVTGVRQIP